jgi:hypothetical protein
MLMRRSMRGTNTTASLFNQTTKVVKKDRKEFIQGVL